MMGTNMNGTARSYSKLLNRLSILVRRAFRINTASCCLFLFVAASAAPVSSALEQETEPGLRIGCTPNIFVEVKAADAAAATKVWAEELKRTRGFGGPTETVVFEDLDAVVSAVKSKKIDLLITLASEYLEIAQQVDLEPRFVSEKAGNVCEESLLLVHRNSNITSLEELKGKNILFMINARSSLGKAWLETLVLQKGYPKIESFFGKVTGAGKYSRAVLPVFFGQADACLVPRDGFNLMAELNPQLRNGLRIIAISPAFLPAVLSIRSDYESNLKDALVDALSNLDKEPRGQQILTLFKTDRLVPYRSSYLDTAKDVLKSHAYCMAGLRRMN